MVPPADGGSSDSQLQGDKSGVYGGDVLDSLAGQINNAAAVPAGPSGVPDLTASLLTRTFSTTPLSSPPWILHQALMTWIPSPTKS